MGADPEPDYGIIGFDPHGAPSLADANGISLDAKADAFEM
jgi:hypothetical protein